MIVPTRLDLAESDLQSLLTCGQQRFRRQRRAVLVSFVRRVPFCDPLDVFDRGALICKDRAYWARPEEGFAMAGVGSAGSISADGARPFRAVAQFWKGERANSLIDAPDATIGTGPILLGGFAFDPARPRTSLWEGFPNGRMILPRYLVTVVGDASWLTVNRVIASDDAMDCIGIQRDLELLFRPASTKGCPAASTDRIPAAPNDTPRVEDLLPATEWQGLVESLVGRLRQGDPRKVVLARACRVRGRSAWQPARTLRSLRASYPACVTFALAHGHRCFLGASPERLSRLRAGTVWTMALAGSIARGVSAGEDLRLGESLLRSAKDRTEHAIVVRAIHNALTEVSSEVTVAPAPTLLKMPNVQHLYTPIVGRVATGRTILDLVERLHPTPGVGGDPRATALEVIRARERLDRGWYAGPVGWLDARDDGEFVVGIRSALLSGSEATLFTGCGIVAASDPAREYAESCWKLSPMLAALTEGVP